MRALSDAEAQGWCSDRGLVIDENFPNRASSSHPEWRRFRVQIPEEATAVVGLAYVLLMSGVRDHVEENFEGAMVWLRRWELWSESIDRVGELLLEGMSGPLGRDHSMRERPALLYVERELLLAHASLSLTMLFRWDAIYCPTSGHLLAAISHHGDLEVVTSREAFDRERERFAEWKPVEV